MEAFTTAPILEHPDPSKAFIMEVDAFKTGVRAVLSQFFGKKPKTYPVAFLKLSTTNRNYDIGNIELLIVKLTLEEL